MNIKNKNILITGGASGIGNYLVSNLAELCNKVFVIDLVHNQDYESTDNIKTYIADVTDFDSLKKVVSDIFINEEIDILINNAGLIHSEPLINLLSRPEKKHSIDNWKKVIETNLSSVFYMTSIVVEKMIENRTKGLIINISSISADGNLGQTAYAAAKAGVNAMTSVWCKELSMFGIRTAAIAPGFFDTPSTKKALNANIIKKLEKSIPIKRLGVLEELLSSVNFIIENDYFNGKVLRLDGGLII